MHKIRNLWKLRLNWSLKWQENKEEKKEKKHSDGWELSKASSLKSFSDLNHIWVRNYLFLKNYVTLEGVGVCRAKSFLYKMALHRPHSPGEVDGCCINGQLQRLMLLTFLVEPNGRLQTYQTIFLYFSGNATNEILWGGHDRRFFQSLHIRSEESLLVPNVHWWPSHLG